jgi:hypothetical protein
VVVGEARRRLEHIAMFAPAAADMEAVTSPLQEMLDAAAEKTDQSAAAADYAAIVADTVHEVNDVSSRVRGSSTMGRFKAVLGEGGGRIRAGPPLRYEQAVRQAHRAVRLVTIQ